MRPGETDEIRGKRLFNDRGVNLLGRTANYEQYIRLDQERIINTLPKDNSASQEVILKLPFIPKR